MLEGLISAAAGLAAQQEQLDAISNDLANLDTTGYKSQRVAFNDLLYNEVDMAGTQTTVGSGANSEIIGRSKAEGSMKETGDPLDVAIEGDGYLEVAGPGGKPALTRDGDLALDASGTLVTSDGYRLSPTVKLPAGIAADEVRIAHDGTVSANGKKLGQLKLVTVTSPDHMQSLGNDLLSPTTASGEPHAATGASLRQGALEQSNVDMGAEMANLVTTERAFQMDTSAIQNESQMMSIANQLRPAS